MRLAGCSRRWYVFPVTGPPIADGTVAIEGDRIVAVGQARPGAEVVDLGNAAILPGFVNAHTHLEFSDLKKPVGTEGMGLVDWIRAVIEARHRTLPDRPRAVELGLQESLACGTTTLGEIAQLDWNPGPPRPEMPRLTVFLELIAPTLDRVQAAVDTIEPHISFPWHEYDSKKTVLPWEDYRLKPGLSPHAPYSVLPEVFDLVASTCAALHWPIAMHLAESREELEMAPLGHRPVSSILERIAGLGPGHAQTQGAADGLPAEAAGGEPGLGDSRELPGRRGNPVPGRSPANDERRLLPADPCLLRARSISAGEDAGGRGRRGSGHGQPGFVTRSERSGGNAISGCRASDCATRRRPAAGHACRSPGPGVRDSTGSLEPGKVADLAVVSLPDRDSSDPYAMLFDSELPVASTCAAACVAREVRRQTTFAFDASCFRAWFLVHSKQVICTSGR